MGHNIEIKNGVASAIFRDLAAWHNLGDIHQGEMRWKDIIEKGWMNFDVSVRQLEWNGNKIDAYGVFRDDNDVYLGYCSQKYHPIQYHSAGEFIDTILEADDGSHYESAGILGKGEKAWVLARIPHDFDIMGNGDVHQTYLLWRSSHDRSINNMIDTTIIRVQCENTLNQAIANTNSWALKIRHSKNADKKLEEAKKMVTGALQTVEAVKEKLERLARRALTKEHYLDILDKIFPDGKKEDRKRDNSRRDNILGEISHLFAKYNENSDFPEYKGTAFSLLNAITEYTDHVRGVRKTEKRADLDEITLRTESAMFGSGETLKQKAFDYIYKSTADCKERDPQIYSVPIVEQQEEIVKPVVTLSPILDDIISNMGL